MKKRKDRATLFAMFFITGIFFMNFFMPDRTFSKEEKRYLAQRPDFLLEEFLDGSYTLEYTDYFSDQFYMRDLWIDIKNKVDHVLRIDSD